MRHSRSLRILCLTLTILGMPGCESEPEPTTIERDAFIDTYVALRSAALLRGRASVDGPLRDTVLREAGVTEEELVTFAEVHGDDLDFMRDVWADVSTRLDSIPFRPVAADSADAG